MALYRCRLDDGEIGVVPIRGALNAFRRDAGKKVSSSDMVGKNGYLWHCGRPVVRLDPVLRVSVRCVTDGAAWDPR